MIREGKILSYGLSNETPWGVSQVLGLAEYRGAPRPVSIQNAYHLMNRIFEIGLSEFSHRDGLGLLAYSPLAAGVLSGKYQGGLNPPGTRMAVATNFPRYRSPQQPDATARYLGIAHAFGLTPVELALAYVYRQPFVTSSIIGATSLEQLKQDIDGSLVELSQDVLDAVDAVQRVYPDPCP